MTGMTRFRFFSLKLSGRLMISSGCGLPFAMVAVTVSSARQRLFL
jgi:hypothetical protein